MKNLRFFFAVLSLSLSFFSGAHGFTEGQRVPPVGISDKGELIFQQDKFSYQSWNTARLPGKVRILQHIAGRSSSQEINAVLIEAIKAEKFPHDRYQTTTMVNTDDAIPGTRMFVQSSIRRNKTAFPWSQFIVDSNSVAKKAWKLDNQGSAIVVLDKEGKVRFAKDGALTQDEVKQVVALVHNLLK